MGIYNLATTFKRYILSCILAVLASIFLSYGFIRARNFIIYSPVFLVIQVRLSRFNSFYYGKIIRRLSIITVIRFGFCRSLIDIFHIINHTFFLQHKNLKMRSSITSSGSSGWYSTFHLSANVRIQSG